MGNCLSNVNEKDIIIIEPEDIYVEKNDNGDNNGDKNSDNNGDNNGSEDTKKLLVAKPINTNIQSHPHMIDENIECQVLSEENYLPVFIPSNDMNMYKYSGHYFHILKPRYMSILSYNFSN